MATAYASVLSALARDEELSTAVFGRMFCTLKDWRRIAARYDKLTRKFIAAVQLAATIIWWV